MLVKLDGWFWFADGDEFIVVYLEDMTFAEATRELQGQLPSHPSEWIHGEYKGIEGPYEYEKPGNCDPHICDARCTDMEGRYGHGASC